MNNISSGRASIAGFDACGLFVRLLSNHSIRVAAAVLMLAGGASVTSSAYAQSSEDAASCVEKCKADEKACLNNGSSEELCDYDSKGCQKACKEGK